jgi:catechol 2,3-dioxygenase-like lactoylglutathione lyase family enzyme
MLHHVSVGVADVERASKFYDPVLAALGYKRVMEFLPYAIGYGDTHPSFWVQLPHDRNAASVGNGVHVGFSARSKEAVLKFHEEALKAGGSNNGEPGPRPDYGPDYYGAFIYDLDGNKIEATLHPEEDGKAARKAARAAASGGSAVSASERSARRAAKKAKRASGEKSGGKEKGDRKAGKVDKKKKAKRKEKRKAKKAKRG